MERLKWGFLIVFVAVLAVAWILPAPISRSKWHSPEGRSLVQLRTLAQACIVYAANNDDQLPDPSSWRSLLVSEVGLSKENLISSAQLGDEDSYHLAPNAEMLNEESILLYEEPSHWRDSVHVAFGDASVKQLSRDDFERLLAEQLANTTP